MAKGRSGSRATFGVPELATADDCDDGEEVSKVSKVAISKAPDVLHNHTRTHIQSITHSQMPGSRYSRRLHQESCALRIKVAVSKAPHLGAPGRTWACRHRRRTRRRLRPGGMKGGPGFRVPMPRHVCARGASMRRPSMHGASIAIDAPRMESKLSLSRNPVRIFYFCKISLRESVTPKGKRRPRPLVCVCRQGAWDAE